MQTFVALYRYTPEAWKHVLERQLDRPEVARRLFEGFGGSLEEMYWMYGDHDAMVIVTATDEAAVMAMAIATQAAGLRVPASRSTPSSARPSTPTCCGGPPRPSTTTPHTRSRPPTRRRGPRRTSRGYGDSRSTTQPGPARR